MPEVGAVRQPASLLVGEADLIEDLREIVAVWLV
jgi:hypothetical protein